MSVVQTTAGTLGINGSLNVQNTLTANEVDLSILKINGTDVTTALQGDAQVATNVANIISGTQIVGTATNANNVAITNVDTSVGPLYLTFGTSTSSASRIETIGTASKFTVDPKDGLLNSEGGFISVNGFVNTKSAHFASSTVSISSAGALVVSESATLNGASVNQLNYLSAISGGIVDLSSAQTITAAKTFTSLATFSGGVSINGDIETGNLSLSNTSVFTIPSGSSIIANSKSVTAANLGWISGLAGVLVMLLLFKLLEVLKHFQQHQLFLMV